MLTRAIVISNARDDIALIKTVLANEGIEVLTFKNSSAALKSVYATIPDIVIMEDRLSTAGSLDLCQQIRQLPPIAVILLGDEECRAASVINGLERGADFYMKRPISMAELVARVKTLLRRRAYSPEPARRLLSVEGPVAGTQSRPVNLTPTELRLLVYMVLHQGRVIPTEELLGAVWAGEKVSTESVKFHISQLRHKLNHGSPQSIRNHWGMGYRLASAEEDMDGRIEVQMVRNDGTRTSNDQRVFG